MICEIQSSSDNDRSSGEWDVLAKYGSDLDYQF